MLGLDTGVDAEPVPDSGQAQDDAADPRARRTGEAVGP
jgi:hypothetical protein